MAQLTSGATLRVAPLFRARIVALNLIAGPAMGDCQVGSLACVNQTLKINLQVNFESLVLVQGLNLTWC
jgi:hypothetical protein